MNSEVFLKKDLIKNSFLFVLSFIVVAFAQPAWIGFFGYFASFFGYSLFWISIHKLNTKKKIYFSFIYFFFVQMIQLSWVTSTKYQGSLILLVYLFLLIWFAFQFAIISYFTLKNFKLSFLKILFIASLWTLFEYSRLFLLCGFSFNPIAIAYANSYLPLQLAAIVGIYGLSFYLLVVNLTCFKAFLEKSKKTAVVWLILAVFPYVFGYVQTKTFEKHIKSSDKINVCLVQTVILPEEKSPMNNYFDKFISPIVQWEQIINLINKHALKKIDIIALPEAALPYSAFDNYYPFDLVKKLFLRKYGKNSIKKLPELKKPMAEIYEGNWYVSNSYFAKALSDIYNAEVIIGLDDYDEKINKSFNAAFYFNPQNENIKRYEKQKLVPIGEYIPFAWLENLASKKYGITSSFAKGEKSKVFCGKYKMGISICYDETYPKIMREAKLNGAKLFVNVSNNAWFYNSKLFRQHFDHAKIRAIENGTPLIRSCNTGVTSAIDSFGRVIDAIYKENEKRALLASLPSFSYKTLYSIWGDYFIIFLSCFFIVVYLIKKQFSKRKSFH